MTQWLPQRYRVTENPLKTERRVELAVMILLALLLLWFLLGLLRQGLMTGPAALPPAADSLVVETLKLEPPLTAEAASDILARPLFWEGRRPLAPVVAVVSKPKKKAPGKLEGVTLHGVYGEGDSLGLIATVDGKLSRISKGSPVKGWQLEGYNDGVAEFTSGGRRATLPLELTTPSVRVAKLEPVENPVDAPSSDDANAERQGAERPVQQQPRPVKPDGLSLGGGLTFGGSAKRRTGD